MYYMFPELSYVLFYKLLFDQGYLLQICSW